MNNNTPALLRTLITYACVVPVAIWLGYLLTQLDYRSTYNTGAILALILVAPLLLRWHHLLLITTWNLGLTIFFLPGSPPIWLLMTALSLGLSVLHRTINNQARFISAPSITWPLIFFLAVVLGTAKLTGGIGLHSLGNETAGGKSYVLLIMGILGYFALTAQPIPPKRMKLYVSLFFLGGCTAFIGDLAPYLPSSLNVIYAFFPMSNSVLEGKPGMLDFQARYGGTASAGTAGFFFMLIRYGPRGIFLEGRLWRLALFALFGSLIFMGGFRSLILLCGGVFVFQCYLERLHKTKMFPVFVFAGVIGITLLIPFAQKLPFNFQRALSFLPLKLERGAVQQAEATKEWRLQLWKDALPIVPQYLLLGRGYAISRTDLDEASNQAFTRSRSEIEDAVTVGSYHSGPLSVVIPLGIWGIIAVLWFWIASLRALLLNYRYGGPELRTVNSFLLAYFISKILLFLIVFGGLYGDMYYFAAIIGLSISINSGICRRAAAPAPALKKSIVPVPARPHPQFRPAFPR